MTKVAAIHTPTAARNPHGLDALAASLRGQAIWPEDAGYDEARAIWNGMIDRRPALIARCADMDDVIRAVRFAREHDLLVAVRGGGHNVAGTAVCDGGIVIDLSAMKGSRSTSTGAPSVRSQGCSGARSTPQRKPTVSPRPEAS